LKDFKLGEILNLLYSKRRLIILVTVIFTLLGFLVALTSPTEWRASNTLVTMSKSGSSIPSSLGNLVGIAGIDIGGSANGEINPLSYEDILSSEFFIDSLTNTKFYSKNLSDSISLYDYHTQYLKTGVLSKFFQIPGLVMGVFASSGSKDETTPLLYKDSIYFHVSFNNQLVIDNIIDRFNIQFDKVKSTLNISFKHQDSYVAAQVIEFSAKYLNGYISGFEMNEQRKTYNFISNQLSILEEEYKHAQKKLVEFQDNNMNLVTNSAMSVEIDLKSKRDLAFDLYSSLQKRKQELEIDLASNPTHLKTLGKTQIPVKKASASKKTIVALYLFLGLFLSLCYLLLRHFIIPNFS